VDVLRSGGPADLRELCLEMAGWMQYLGGVAKTVSEGKQQSAQLISSGKALEKFRQMVELQGGDCRIVDDAKRLPQAPHTMQVTSSRAGWLNAMQCEQIGTACVILGGGRERKEDLVDPAVGIVLHKKVGDRIDAREPIATLYYKAEAKAARARQLIAASCEITDSAPSSKRPLIHRVIGKPAENN